MLIVNNTRRPHDSTMLHKHVLPRLLGLPLRLSVLKQCHSISMGLPVFGPLKDGICQPKMAQKQILLGRMLAAQNTLDYPISQFI